jgi:hypothetical protein
MVPRKTLASCKHAITESKDRPTLIPSTGCAVARSCSISNWTTCRPCDEKCGLNFLAESRKHKGRKLLCGIPCIGPIRAARLIALTQTPHRFRSKRQLWL